MTTVLTESGELAPAGAEANGESLWLSARDAHAATGWTAEARGLWGIGNMSDLGRPRSPQRRHQL